jgi:hypothetical protein
MGRGTRDLSRRELLELGAAAGVAWASLGELPAFALPTTSASGGARVTPIRGDNLTGMTREAIGIVGDTLDNLPVDWKHAQHIDIEMHRRQREAAGEA